MVRSDRALGHGLTRQPAQDNGVPSENANHSLRIPEAGRGPATQPTSSLRGPLPGVAQERVRLVSSAPLAALRRTGTAHVDADTTRLIVASVREWQMFFRVAGCDVFTAPCGVLDKFLSQTDMPLES
jgi:hypothetical protein